jgi:predicted nuclease of predicted toxin-antitoxin system
MIIWIDAHLSPSLAAWINRTYTSIEAKSVSSLGLQRADDKSIFEAARKAGAVIMSKDPDFLKLIDQLGVPPQILWITCGNTSNARMREVLEKSLNKAVELLCNGEPVVEISDLR